MALYCAQCHATSVHIYAKKYEPKFWDLPCLLAELAACPKEIWLPGLYQYALRVAVAWLTKKFTVRTTQINVSIGDGEC